MKKSFKQIIDETYAAKESWDYYSNNQKDFDYNPMDSVNNSERFLKEFIELSGKSEKNALFVEIDKLKERTTHVVSTFFIGHYIYNNTIFKDLIDKEVNNLVKVSGTKSDVSFSFLWFITCLFHDLGYKIEESKCLVYDNFSKLKTSLNNVLSENNAIPKFYNQIYKNYFDYRIKKHSKNDHGIVAAYLLYDSLHKIRELAENNPTNTQKRLCWEEELLNVYNFCAWNILGHNIWFGKKSDCCDVKLYTKHKMKRLLLEKNKFKINLKKHPFFFLFCLVDTIEPFKKTLNYDLLDKVYLEINEDKLIISTDLICGCAQQILKQAESLSDWITESINEDNKVKIFINNE